MIWCRFQRVYPSFVPLGHHARIFWSWPQRDFGQLSAGNETLASRAITQTPQCMCTQQLQRQSWRETPVVSTCKATKCPSRLRSTGQTTVGVLSIRVSLLLWKPKLHLLHHKCVTAQQFLPSISRSLQWFVSIRISNECLNSSFPVLFIQSRQLHWVNNAPRYVIFSTPSWSA